MANTGPSTNGYLKITDIPMTGSDITFTFDVKAYKVLLQSDAAVTKIFASPTTSSTIGGFTLPVITSMSPPLELVNVNGQTFTFNGTNATNLQIMEFLTAST